MLFGMHWKNWVKFSGELDQTEIKRFFDLRITELENRLWKSDQGHGVDQISGCRFGNQWLWGSSSSVRGNKFIKAFKILSNNLPVRLNLNRGKEGVNNKYRLCGEKTDL